MIHYLIAAGIGAAVSAVAYAGIALWTGKPITLKGLAVSALGGLVAGVLCATPGGVAALQAGGARALTFVAIDGAAAAGSEKVAENALNAKPLGEGVGEAVAWGTATAPLAYLGLRGYTQQFSKVFFPARAAADAAAEAAALQAAANGTEAVVNAGRNTARTYAVKITNAIAIAGGNPTVARALSELGALGENPSATPTPDAANTTTNATVTTDTTASNQVPPVATTIEQPPTETVEEMTGGAIADPIAAPAEVRRGRGVVGALGDQP